MKRFILSVMAIATIALTGCGKGEDVKPSLSGTKWVEVDARATSTLTFSSDVNCDWLVTIKNSSGAVAMQYTYEYNHPNVDMYPKVEGYAKMKGVISGNKMDLINTSKGETIATLTKQ